MGRRRMFTDTEKWCPQCKTWKVNDLFHVVSTTPSGFHSWCKECVKLKTNKTQKEDYRREWSYGVTPEKYKEMWDSQNGKCAMPKCDRPPTCIDHDHTNNKVRQLLCKGCNTALGIFKDDPEMLRDAADYVERYRG